VLFCVPIVELWLPVVEFCVPMDDPVLFCDGVVLFCVPAAAPEVFGVAVEPCDVPMVEPD
jgi:hypothetical protein